MGARHPESHTFRGPLVHSPFGSGAGFLENGDPCFCLERSLCEPKTWGGALARFPWILDKSHLRELDHETRAKSPPPCARHPEERTNA